MGKKKIKNNDWDLSYEEQKELLRQYDKFESGNSTIEEFTSDEVTPVATIDEQIEQLFMASMEEKDDTTKADECTDVADVSANNGELIQSNVETGMGVISYPDQQGALIYEEHHESLVKMPVNEQDISIRFNYISGIDKLIINDGTTAKTFAIDRSIEDELYDVPDDYSEEDLGYDTALLYAYIITCQHPCAIISNSKYAKDFSNVESFDRMRFKFVSVDNFVLLYTINADELNRLFSLNTEYGMTVDEAINFWINLAYVCNSINNTFYIESPEYITAFMNICDEKDNYEKFKEAFFSDSDTIVCNTGEQHDNTLEFLDDAEYIQTKARNLIESFIDDEDEDDEDDFDNSQDSNTNNVSNNTEAIEYMVGTTKWTKVDDNMIEKLSGKSPTVQDDKNINKSNESEDGDDDMIVPVITRNS